MALSERNRAKQAGHATKILPPGTQVRTYVMGRGHARMTTGVIVAGILFVAAFVIGLMLGRILIPGLLLILYVLYEVQPIRGVAVTDRGLAVVNRSFWNGKPSKVIELLPPAPVFATAPTGSVTLQLGAERVTLKRDEFDRLAAATTAPSI